MRFIIRKCNFLRKKWIWSKLGNRVTSIRVLRSKDFEFSICFKVVFVHIALFLRITLIICHQDSIWNGYLYLLRGYGEFRWAFSTGCDKRACVKLLNCLCVAVTFFDDYFTSAKAIVAQIIQPDDGFTSGLGFDDFEQRFLLKHKRLFYFNPHLYLHYI